MKEYERYVLWLDYFDSETKRSGGRRVPLSGATRAPKLAELEEACRKLNLQPAAQPARYPGSQARESGYVSVRKVKPKAALVLKVAKELASVRAAAARKAGQGQPAQRK